MELIGRGRETAALDRLLARATDGEGSGLVLWGDPGIGKTALVEYVVEAASQATVLRCRGTRVETGIPFAALHELLWPVADGLETLPTPQGAALRGALGVSREPANRFLIGAAVLSLLAELARRRPVLVVVDDAQWVDEASTHCLGFVARRVRSAAIVVLLTGHEDPASGPWEGLPSWEVMGLADDDARRLVRAAAPGADETLVDETVRAAGGNPLALHELPTLATDDDRGAGLPPPGEPPAVGPRLRQAFCARAETLKPRTRDLLLLAAAEGKGDRNVVQRAAAAWGVDPANWDEAQRSGLLRVQSTRVEFRHPLIPAALYDGATASDRQAAHRTLAASLPEDAVEARAWHLATAADGPDEHVAGLLDLAAERCLARSAGPMAAHLLRRGAELSPAPADAVRRLAAAARAAWDAGQAEVASRMLREAERRGDVLTVVRRSGGLRGILEFAYGMPELAHHHLVGDTGIVVDQRTAVELATVAVRAAWSAGRPDLQREALSRLLALEVGDDADLSPVIPVLRAWWTCYDETAELVLPVPDAGADVVGLLGTVPWELLPPALLVQAWGSEGPLHDVLRMQAVQLRRRQELAALAMVLSQAAVLDAAAGRWDVARSAAEEGLRLAEEAGASHVATQCRLSLAILAAARGEEGLVNEHTARALAVSVPRGVRALNASAYWLRGRAALFGGRPQEALDHLMPLDEHGHEASHSTFALLAAADTAEAAAQVGRPDVVGTRLAVVEDWARRSGAAWAWAAAHRLRALAAGHQPADAVETAYRAALDQAGAQDDPFEHARTRLLFGEWLRRARRRADARHELTAAAATFERLGAAALQARALREGELTERPGARRDQGAAAEAGLTAQELRVTRLAAEGKTNREIATQLMISHRTVGHHLAAVYPKLGITSRAELARIDVPGDLRLRAADEIP